MQGKPDSFSLFGIHVVFKQFNYRVVRHARIHLKTTDYGL